MRVILVLDDEPSIMNLVRRILTEYKLIEATTAEQALQLSIDYGHQIALLLADVTLPTSSGIHVALLLRCRNPHLPVLLTSGYPVSYWNDRDTADLERLGSHLVTIIQKPFSVEELSKVVAQMTGQAHSGNV